MHLFPSSRTDFLLMNNTHQPFGNVHVRRAIAYALNRKAMIDAVLFGHGKPANSVLSPALWAYDAATPGIQYDLAMAKKELAQSPLPHGFSTTLMVGSGAANEQSLGQIVQAQLKAIGIKVTLKPVDPNNEYTLQQNGQYDLGFSYDTTDIIDPSELIAFSAMGGKTGSQTRALFTNYDNPQIDSWGGQALGTFAQQDRQLLYSKIQRQFALDSPMAFLYYSPSVFATKGVSGLFIYPTGNYHLENVSLTH